MDVEQQMRETYAERLGDLELSGGDVDAARRTGTRLRARRRLVVGAAAVVVVAVAVGGTLVGTDRISVGPSHTIGHWRELPTPPLTPRADAQGVWTGREVVVVGGETDPCPPNADCGVASDELRDGAAYDPTTNSWRPIPPAPVPVGPGDRLVMADGVVVLRHALPHGSSWFTYEPDHNRWSPIDGVPRGVGDLPSAIGPRVYAPTGRRVAVYDVTRFRWSLLPPDRIRPALTQRRVTATSVGPVVTGLDSTQPNDGRTPSVVLADVWDGRAWHRLPATGQLGNDWYWTGTRMVDPDPTVVDGGEVDPFSHAYPSGGILDPETGDWQPLPEAVSDSAEGGWGLNAQGGRWSATYGQVYDTGAGKAWTLRRPDGAPDLGTTAVWAADMLMVVGGVAYGSEESSGEVTNQAWLYTP
jgi:hypothetical protein